MLFAETTHAWLEVFIFHWWGTKQPLFVPCMLLSNVAALPIKRNLGSKQICGGGGERSLPIGSRLDFPCFAATASALQRRDMFQPLGGTKSSSHYVFHRRVVRRPHAIKRGARHNLGRKTLLHSWDMNTDTCVVCYKEFPKARQINSSWVSITDLRKTWAIFQK